MLYFKRDHQYQSFKYNVSATNNCACNQNEIPADSRPTGRKYVTKINRDLYLKVMDQNKALRPNGFGCHWIIRVAVTKKTNGQQPYSALET